ncbi:hypothetical protein BDY21DRAFT_365560 [Lineolata rhizophorae]|uniref:Nab2-like CCCH zinc finger domain-containing protein n=1 Tax=Lineolata rhizophorae TaxID=578093 RepID=A0A6A6NUE4_9PEZI|nr:hypothetical protein BDY21DRAFT_365560 [Lineolata rhizophorae]
MAVELAAGTPLAAALQSAVQPKLVEVGWSSGEQDDSDLSEYIVLMLVNRKTQEQIASELANDLLNLGPEDSSTIEFSRWLFEQVDTLSRQMKGEPEPAPVEQPAQGEPDEQPAAEGGQDAEMGDAPGGGEAATNIPTGPKAMRNGSAPNPRDKRMLGQLNRAMERSGDAALHRVRGSGQGNGRINSHANRDPPKGPRNQMMNRMANNMGRGMPQQMPPGMGPMPGQPGPNPNAMFMTMTPEQQYALLHMYEEQASFFAQMFGNAAPHVNPNFPNGHGMGNQPNQRGGGQGRSLFDRVEKQPNQSHRSKQQDGGDAMDTEPDKSAGADTTGSMMDIEGTKDKSETVCRFNLSCTKPDCAFAHQSPAAPPGIAIDVSDTCSFGAACMNRKCTGSHPSPSKRSAHNAETDCKYWPNCTNRNCTFRHPNMPPCRNGGDCTEPGCKFAHSQIKCKYNPCLNAFCPHKHAEGQKRGKFEDKVWTASGQNKDGENGGKEREHVSERKFVDETAEEELILPGSGLSAEESTKPESMAGDVAEDTS